MNKININSPAIILVEPQLGENIGFSARAMLNFDINNLRIVNPREDWPNKKAISTSAGAIDSKKSEINIYNTSRIFYLSFIPRNTHTLCTVGLELLQFEIFRDFTIKI